jgi:nucleolar pre-ribosomal-associated protein 1
MFEHHKQSNQHFTKRPWVQDGPSFKGQPQIHLLLMYVKNTVTEICQQLPYVLVLFAAEASCILMHPENPHYPIITRYLLRGPSMDLEVQ